MKQRIFNLIILDESGSMYGIKQETINSVNETIQTIRKAQQDHPEQEHYVSAVTFNNEAKTVYNCVEADKVKEFGPDNYNPNCNTALHDAMGSSLNSLRTKVAQDDRVLVTVITDGYENASKEYNHIAIKDLVDELKRKGWVFAYIGANHDVTAAAATISITNVMSFEASSGGTCIMSDKLNRSRERLYHKFAIPGFCSEEANTNFFDEDK